VEPLSAQFLRAILDGDITAALAIAREARQRGLPYFYEQVVTAALVEVGRRWERGEVTVADEHLATAVAQSVIASFYGAFPWAPDGPKGVVACVAGERHELGARMAADLLAYDGWNVRFVGADVPLDALLELVAREQPRFVGLSIGLAERLPELQAAIARLRAAAPSTRLVVGGRGLAGIDAGALGADVVARSAAESVAALRAWKS
jgi:methanogenic corrinoid protein MtbC1